MENDLRQKLMHAELENLMECVERLESISGLSPSYFENFKNAASNVVSTFKNAMVGTIKASEVMTYLENNLKDATVTKPNNDLVEVVRNGIKVEVMLDSNKKWILKIGDRKIEMKNELADILRNVDSHTRKNVAAEARDVLRYSQAILKCKATPAAVHF